MNNEQKWKQATDSFMNHLHMNFDKYSDLFFEFTEDVISYTDFIKKIKEGMAQEHKDYLLFLGITCVGEKVSRSIAETEAPTKEDSH